MKQGNKRTVIDNILSLSVVRGMDYLIPLITLPYLVRVLGIEKFGLINYSLAFALYFSAIMQYGFSVTAVRNIARNRGDIQTVERIYSETITAIALLTGICAVVYFSIVFLVDSFRQNFALYAFSFLFVAMQAMFPVWFFQGMESMRQSAVITITARLCMLAGILVLVRNPDDFYKVPALNASAFAGCAVFSVFWIYKHYHIKYSPPTLPALINVYRQGKDAFAAQLAPNLYNNSATFLLGVFGGAASVGIYSAAIKVTEVFNSAGLIISQAFFPYLARNKQYIRDFHKLMLLTGSVLTVLCWWAADWITLILFSADNGEIAHYIRWLSMGILFCFTTLAFHNNYLMLVGRDDVVRRISFYTSLLFFVTGIFLVHVYGIYGAMLMLLGARMVMALWGLLAYIKIESSKIK